MISIGATGIACFICLIVGIVVGSVITNVLNDREDSNNG